MWREPTYLGLTLSQAVVILAVVVLLTIVILDVANDFYISKKLIDNLSNSSSLPYKGNPNIPA